MDELFDIYSKNYRVEWKVNNECFYLYFNDDKLRLVVCDDLLFLDKYNNIFKKWFSKTHCHPDNLENLQILIEKILHNKTRY